MVSAIHTMTKQQQLIALHAHLCECTTATGTKCGGFYSIFHMLGMEYFTSDIMQELFNELQNMGLITEYTHLPGNQYVADRWICMVIKREFPQSNTTNND